MASGIEVQLSTGHSSITTCPCSRRQSAVPSAPINYANDNNVNHFCEDVLELSINFSDVERTNLLHYVNEIPPQIKKVLASFLKTGDPEELNITDDTFHYYVHIATHLHYESLSKVCITFFTKSQKKDYILSSFGECECCRETIESARNESTKDLTNIKSTFANLKETETPDNSPRYAILFMKTDGQSSNDNVFIMNLTNGHEILKQNVKKVHQFGEGFASCSLHIDECPYIFISGGSSKMSKNITKYDVVLNRWSECARLTSARSNHMMASVNKCCYIFGGHDCDSVEMYNPITKTCKEIAKLKVAVNSSAYVVFGHKIYIFGGKFQGRNVSCVQCLDTRTNSVNKLLPLPCECSGGQAILLNDQIYFATGQCHLIKFDPNTGYSQLCAQQPYRRKHFVMYERKGKIFISGGVRKDESSSTESSMCKYCPKKDTWVKKVLTFRQPFPIYTSCIVKYPKKCPIVPFVDLYPRCR